MNTPVIVIAYPYPLGQANGGARMTREIAIHLGRLGARVFVLAVSAPPRLQYPRFPEDDAYLGFEFDPDFQESGVEVVRVAPNRYHWSLDGLEVRRALRKIMRREKVDLVLGYFHEVAFLPGLLRRRNIKFGYISTWLSYKFALGGAGTKRHFRKFFRSWIDREFIVKPHRQADILFATSDFTRTELMESLGVSPEKIRICQLGVDRRFLEIPRARPESIQRFLFFGRVVRPKGLYDAMKALGEIAAEGTADWSYKIFGQGHHEWAAGLARDNKIEGQVEIQDEIGDELLRRELEQAHLALMPSHSEAFGLSIAEAQAAGLPVIAYDVGSVPEVVDPGRTAWLAPYREIDRLAEYLREAIADPEKTYQMGLAGRAHIAEKFSWEHTARAILDGLDTLRASDRKP